MYQALAIREADGVDHPWQVESVRLNDLRAAIWEDALGGDPKSVALAVKIIHQEIRLFGLDSAHGLTRNGPISMMAEDWGISTSSSLGTTGSDTMFCRRRLKTDLVSTPEY